MCSTNFYTILSGLFISTRNGDLAYHIVNLALKAINEKSQKLTKILQIARWLLLAYYHYFCLLIRSANFSYGFLRKSGHAHYRMFFFQQIRRWLLVHYALEVVEKVELTVYMCTNDIKFLTVFEGSFKDVDIIIIILAWLLSNEQQVKYQLFLDVFVFCLSKQQTSHF